MSRYYFVKFGQNIKKKFFFYLTYSLLGRLPHYIKKMVSEKGSYFIPKAYLKQIFFYFLDFKI